MDRNRLQFGYEVIVNHDRRFDIITQSVSHGKAISADNPD